MESELLSGLIGLLVLIVSTALTSAARTAYTSLRRQNLQEQADEGSEQAKTVLDIADDPSRILTTFQLSMLLHYFLTAGLLTLFLLPRIVSLLGQQIPALVGYAVLMPVAAILIYILTEVLPDVVVNHNSNQWAIALAGPTRFIVALFSPLVALMDAIREAALGEGGGAIAVTEEEIMTLIAAGEEEGSIEIQEREMISRVFRLDETLAREIMVPRIDIVALEIDTPLEDAREVIIDAGHSRIPVYDESLDQIQGLLYAKDLLNVWHFDSDDNVSLGDLMREAVFVPETKRVSELLQELQSKKVHLAIVIDEYGGTAGLATIEDIVEEIVGEILDEYDTGEEALYHQIEEDEFIVDARIDLDDFNRLLDVRMPIEHGEETLGGLIYARLGKVPDAGEIIEVVNLYMEIISVIDQRVRKVRIKRIAVETGSPDEEEQNTRVEA